MTTTVTTVRLSGKRKQIVEYIALQAGAKCGQLLKKAMLFILIDRYGNAETIGPYWLEIWSVEKSLALKDNNENKEVSKMKLARWLFQFCLV